MKKKNETLKKDKEYFIIFLSPTLFKFHHWKRFEFNNFPKNYQIEVHVLQKLYFQKIPVSYQEKNKIKKNIKIFSSTKEWKFYFLKKINELKKNNIKLVVFKNENKFLKDLDICFFLKKNKIYFNFYAQPGLPNYQNEDSKKIKNNYFKIIFKLKNLIFNFKYSLNVFITLLVTNFSIKLKIIPKNILFHNSNQSLLNIYKNKIDKSKFIPIHSTDYSNTLVKGFKDFNAKYKYAVFIDFPMLGEQQDANFLNKNNIWINKSNEWYKYLNNFFDLIEKKLNFKILIAAHPKSTNLKMISKIYNKRKIFQNKTIELIKNSKLILTVGSTVALSAINNNKPIIFIYSNESKKDHSSHNWHIFLTKLIGSTMININNFVLTKKILNNVLKINKRKYDYIKKKYIYYFRKKNITNSEIIQKKIDNLISF